VNYGSARPNRLLPLLSLPLLIALRDDSRMTFHVATGDAAALHPLLASRDVDLLISRISDPIGAECSADILFHNPSVIVTGAKIHCAGAARLHLASS
jgi:hypothetical protein